MTTRRRTFHWREYLIALTTTALCTAIALPLYPQVDLVNVTMFYLLGTTLCALRLGRAPLIVLAALNLLAFDFFFVPPVFSFDVQDAQYLFTMAVMLTVALVIAHLMVNVRRHRDRAAARESRTAVLYAMSRELAISADAPAMVCAAVRHLHAVFHRAAVVLAVEADGSLSPIVATARADESDLQQCQGFATSVAREVVERGDRCTRNGVIYLPLQGVDQVTGVLVMCSASNLQALPEDQLHLLDAFAAQLGLSLQRATLAQAAEVARISAERALLRNTLLASISHDLRTPLAALAGAGSLIAQPEYALNADRRMTLGRLIERKARDMTHLLSNILELMQMESSTGCLRTAWHSIVDLVDHALRANECALAQHRINLNLPEDLPLILVDSTLALQILGNLLENAAKYTQAGTTITISAMIRGAAIVLVVEDDGPGLPAGDPERLFEKFQRGRAESNVVGVGLGLAICRAAAHLHGGEISAADNRDGGARFEITLPVEMQFDPSPELEVDALGV